MFNDDAIPMARMSSEGLDSEEAFSLWNRSLEPFFQTTPTYDAKEEQPAAIDVNQYHLGNFLFYETAFPKQKFTRDAGWMAQHDDADHVVLQCWVKGANDVINGDKLTTFKPGNLFCVNLAYEVDADSDDSTVISLALSREWVRQFLPNLLTMRGKVFSEDWGMNVRIFNDYLLSLKNNLPHVKATDIPMLNDNLLGMLESLITYNDIGSNDVKDTSVSVICQYIDRNLTDAALGVDSICKHFRCSRATLYRLFKPHGGVRDYIQKRRLAASFRMLTSPSQSHRQIFDVASRFGFVNPSHFSSLFKRHFNISPKEARALAQEKHLEGIYMDFDSKEVKKVNNADLMRHWAKTLKAGV